MSKTKPIEVKKSNISSENSSKCNLDNLIFNKLYKAYCNNFYLFLQYIYY